jgi:hypothetical protein
MAEQLLTGSLFPDEAPGSPAVVTATVAPRRPRGRAERERSEKTIPDSRQITLAEAGWPA